MLDIGKQQNYIIVSNVRCRYATIFILTIFTIIGSIQWGRDRNMVIKYMYSILRLIEPPVNRVKLVNRVTWQKTEPNK